MALSRRVRPLREKGRGGALLRPKPTAKAVIFALLPMSRPPSSGQRVRHVALHRSRAGALAHRHHDPAVPGSIAPSRMRCSSCTRKMPRPWRAPW